MNPSTRGGNSMSKFTLKRGHILGLRTNAQNLRSHGGFQWPESGKVNAPDWSPAAECGNGLHFLKWGDGDVNLLHSPYDQKTKWLVISTPEKGAVDLNGKSKCEECEVVYCGEKQGAIDLLVAHAPAGTKIAYSTATAGDGGTATAGDGGTATAGDEGTATAGDEGTATAGDGGTATAGDGGVITIAYYDNAKGKYRRLIGHVGDGGLKPNVAYRINDQCQFEEVPA